MSEVLIVGCGDIGTRVAARYVERGTVVTGIVSSPVGVSRLRVQGLAAVQMNLDNPLDYPIEAFPLRTNTTLFYFAPPPKTGNSDPRLDAFLAALSAATLPERLVYISTSAVYGDCAGAWIDESAPVRPLTARGRRRAAAEQSIERWSEHTAVPTCVLRVPGIYGPGRLPVERLQRGLPVLRAEDSPYTNRIHADDLADVAIAAAERGRSGAIYNVSDGNPTSMSDYFNRVADLVGLPRPPQVSLAEARESLTPEMMSFLEESKRLVTARLREELQFTPRYPDLAHGLPSCI